ncbi:hypothetical protein BDB01DRAFT_802460 [Pilobolus umbonatus]|nr:hypothetical protein BDB01DRAFT_802460 [Pilobolus umbonatus]
MEQLSLELVERLTSYLGTRDFYHCSTINKFWYNISIPLLYANINFRNERRLCLCIDAITTYPRTKEAGYFIMELDLNRLTHFTLTSQSGKTIDPITALLYCPNLQKLALPYIPELLDSLLSEEIPVLKHLKTLDLGYHSTIKSGKQIMDCYYKFRLTLTYLNLIPVRYAFGRRIPDQMSAYIQSFPRLNHILFLEPYSLEESPPLLGDIFAYCPHLTHVNYLGCDINKLMRRSKNSCPQLKSLELCVGYIDLQNILYIKRRFTSITKLVLRFSVKPNSKMEYLFSEIMTIKTLSILQITLYLNREDHPTSWEYAKNFLEYPLANTTNKLLFIRMHDTNETISLFYDRSTHTRNLLFPLSTVRYAFSHIENSIKMVGKHLDTLEIGNYVYQGEPIVDRHEINEVFPRLSQLCLRNRENEISNSTITPNHRMKTITLGGVKIDNTFLRDIETCYPLLHHLKISLSSKRMNLTARYPDPLRLPETGLKSVTFNFPVRMKWHIVVVKEVNGYPVKVWYYDWYTNSVLITEHEEALAVTHRRSNKKRILLKSSTIEEIVFITH